MSLKLLTPEKKYYLLSLGLILDILIFLYTAFDFSGNYIWLYPENPGEDVIDTYNIPGSPVSILMNRPEIFPLFSEPWIHVGIPVEAYGFYRGIFTLFIAITCLTTIENIYNIIKIQKYK
ncbi:unnamed protein product [marine sediment metagenome]|uniref:Uncharacterized protein n=1 Tax=marine sediment metagenome TaxID=412755 RepID=X0YVR6_9ZZZZ